jgi:DNA-binding response OmpR family regulator
MDLTRDSHGAAAMTSSTRRILYVDMDAEARLLMRELLAPHQIDVAASDTEARILARRNGYDIYILAGGGPGSTGLALCAWLHRIDPRTPILFCSSDGQAQYQQRALAAGALRYQLKPIDPKLLRSTLGLLLKLAELESTRAFAAEQHAIGEELIERSRHACESAKSAREKAEIARACMLRAKAYRAFRNAGGNRANFERMWPAMSVALSSDGSSPGTIGRKTPVNSK